MPLEMTVISVARHLDDRGGDAVEVDGDRLVEAGAVDDEAVPPVNGP